MFISPRGCAETATIGHRHSEVSTVVSEDLLHPCRGVLGGDNLEVLKGYIPRRSDARGGDGVHTYERFPKVLHRRLLHLV